MHTFLIQYSKSLMTIVWAFCCGFLAIIWIIVWLGIWIAATYFTIVTIQKMRVTVHDNFECDVTLVVISGLSLLLNWMVFVGLCCFAGFAFHNRRKSGQHQTSDENIHRRHTKENIYDAVPQECD